MEEKFLVTLLRMLKYVLLGGAILFILLYIFIAINRITYPYQLEWMEGGSVDHVRRILSGNQLYIEPSLQFTPYIYTPLYFYISSLVSRLFGIGFFPLRLVSFLSSIGCFLIIFQFVKRETSSLICGLLSVSLYAATFIIGGAWFDIARVDSLFLLFLLGGIYLLRFKTDLKSIFISGILISLSFLTKQVALFVAILMSFYCFLILKRWSRFVFAITVLFIVGSSTILFNWITDGWYYFYVFGLPTQHSILLSKILTFWSDDLTKHLSVALGVSVFYIIYLLSKSKYKDFFFFSFLFVSMIGASWFSRLHLGGFDNVLLPAYAVIAIYFGLGISILLEDTNLKNKYFELLIFLLCIAQFFSLSYNPLHQIPTKADNEAGDKFVRLMQGIEGDIFVPYHGFLPALANKNTYSHSIAIWDVLRSENEGVRNKLEDEIKEAILNKKFEAIIIDYDLDFIMDEINQNYEYRGPIFDDDRVFWTFTGVKTRPNAIYSLRK